MYTDDDEEKDGNTSNRKMVLFRHYGGSVRAWDGSMQGRVSNETIAVVGSAKKQPAQKVASKPIHHEEGEEEEEDDDIMEDQEYDSDEFRMDLSNTSPVTKRTAPRRQSRKAIKYNELAGEEGESEGDESDNSSVKHETTKKDPGRKGKTGLSSKKGQVPAITKQPPKRNGKSNVKSATETQPEIEIDSDEESVQGIRITKSLKNSKFNDQDDDDEDFAIEIEDSIAHRPLSRRLSARSKNTPAKSYAEDDDESFDDGSSSEDDLEARDTFRKGGTSTLQKPASKPAARKSTTPAKRKASVNQKRALQESDPEESSPQEDSDSSFDAWDVPPRKKAKKKPFNSATKKASASTRNKPSVQKSKHPLGSDGDSSRDIPMKPSTKYKKSLSDACESSPLVKSNSTKKPLKKEKQGTIYESDSASDGVPVSKASVKLKSASSRKAKQQSESLPDYSENCDQISVNSSESGPEEFDSSAAKSVLAMGIMRGKAARPSLATRTEKLSAQDVRKNPTTPGSASRRRRQQGRSPPKSASKPSVIDLVDDKEFSFL
jgi:hypothetical protein